ncbi:GAF domain-containing protein [Fulvivirga sp. M361]|uniref:GAF domain-containing protein n=1 Tax=Fulvivirga sp. M361 TaxID=2594266 RepID=UPI00117A7343|nr:GAF domain-containing protein [Fulvivirga sp. M361]TRX58469.1 GAF domain-containing protein [Fulvivirga sp. M361]
MDHKFTADAHNEFPFETVLNLSSLLTYWEENLKGKSVFSGYPADHILEMINNAPELRQPVRDLALLDKHQELLGLLMSVIFPPALLETELSGALIPFDIQGFYSTPGYQEILPFNEIREDLTINIPGNDMKAGKIMHACLIILNKFYGTHIDLDVPIVITVPHKDTGLKKIYKVDMNTQFTDVVAKGELDPIDGATVQHLLENLYDTELWLKHLRPENFEFQGFTIFKLVDVTTEEMLSDIKYYLLRKDAITCEHNFLAIQQRLRSIFSLPEMELGIAYYDSNNNIITNYGASEWKSLIMPEDNCGLTCDYFEGSIYEKVRKTKRPVIIENLESIKEKTHIEKQILKKGFKNVAIAPLMTGDNVVGILELVTPYPGKLNPVNAGRLENILPMFTSAVERVLGEMQTEVRALIQKECTAIHPTVEWKFLEAGYDILNARRLGTRATLDDITFKEVYPLFGMADIRNSSVERSKAIQQDLMRNLREAKRVISTILEYKKMPILDEINYRVDTEIDKISSGLNSGDESEVLNFLKNEIQPTFNHFKNEDDMLKLVIDEYEGELDPLLGVVYDKRRNFETSLMTINECISTHLDNVEQQAQEIFPHYFEKYKTDGVEYNMYLGQSLVKGKTFDHIYLRNFRLWQLFIMCEIAIKVEKLKNDLPKKLDIAQLILVHGEPLAIRFRKDEKHFDVDGAYNIRYEIVKKRIDKAYIKNRKERLTQPGKIAIVYTGQREATEYDKYIKYLQSIGYLSEEVEHVELEELQGAQGLKAIRVSVNLGAIQKEFGNEMLKNVMEVVTVN